MDDTLNDQVAAKVGYWAADLNDGENFAEVILEMSKACAKELAKVLDRIDVTDLIETYIRQGMYAGAILESQRRLQENNYIKKELAKINSVKK